MGALGGLRPCGCWVDLVLPVGFPTCEFAGSSYAVGGQAPSGSLVEDAAALRSPLWL